MHNKIVSQGGYRQIHETDLPPFEQYLEKEVLRDGTTEIPDKPGGKAKKAGKRL
ncbi:MAG: hypothetical protein HN675_15780 [Opitutae bacterium]|nr:hypothetical protein [Opitutae bacterium]